MQACKIIKKILNIKIILKNIKNELKTFYVFKQTFALQKLDNSFKKLLSNYFSKLI